MKTRLIGAAAVGAIVLVAAVVGQYAWGALLAVAATLAAHEALRLVQMMDRRPTLQVALPLAPALVLTALWPDLDLTRFVIALAVILAFGAQIIRQENERSTGDFAATLAWPLYVGILMSYAVLLRGLDGGLGWTALLLTYVWANDSFAYLGGRAFGRTPFFASLSPRKTWEGALSGAAAAVVVGLAAPAVAGALVDPISSVLSSSSETFGPLASSSPLALAALGLALSVVAPMGDLSKSFVKRQAGAKDSGSLIPGHGGVLDRMDSLLFSSPVVYYAILLALTS